MACAGILLMLGGLVGWVWTIIDAFQTDSTQGVLCLLVPFYIFFFLIAVSDNPAKWLQLGLIVVMIIGSLMARLG
jgi:hypothetical protein